MNPDFAIVLNFKLTGNADADFLVKTARNIGIRAVMSDNQQDDFAKACSKYNIFLAKQADGLDLNSDNVIDTIVTNRQNGKNTIINLPVIDGKIAAKDQEMLDALNTWMHLFGHALNESQKSELKADHGFILENRHANYQKYVFLKRPLPEKVVVTGLKHEPNRIEWIDRRTDLDFNFKDGKLTIDLTKPESDLTWQVVRLQAHRPEDDIIHTEF